MRKFRFPNPARVGEGELHVLATGVLLIRHQGKLHCIDNKCGHFGLPLDDGRVADGAIYCRQHGISFSLTTGEVVNRPWENCDKVRVYPVEESEAEALIDLAP